LDPDVEADEGSDVERAAMPVQPTYPGVYLQEIPSGNRTLTGVATAITAFVGRALCGRADEPVPIASFGEFERVFGGLWIRSGLGYAVRDYFLNGGSAALILRLAGGALTASAAVDNLTVSAASPGAWGTGLWVGLTPADTTNQDVQAAAAGQGVTAADLFDLTVWEASSGTAAADVAKLTPSEAFRNLTVVDGPRRADRVLRGSRLVAVGALPATAPKKAEPQNLKAATTNTTPDADGSPLVNTDYLGKAADHFDAGNKGLFGLRKADLFTLLCLPPSDPVGFVPPSVWVPALGLCQERRAFLLVDPPPDASVADIPAFRSGNGLTGDAARYGALYYPRVTEFDPLRGGALGEFVPCGAVAGVMARTDVTRGVWKAPAGIDAGLTGVNGLSAPMTDTDSGTLNPIGINALRTFPNIGTVVWGARTLRGADVAADDYKYVPVRRLASFLEESLYRGTQWVVFEPNDEPLWRQIRTSVGAFMQSLFRQGAFQGSTPKQAYFVQCDADTTTQYDIDRGIVNIIVGFAPLKPAEFVVISIQQIAGPVA
jgi:phage tail sheath protein FI